MDVVFDLIGGDTFEWAFATVRNGGFVVTSVAFPKDEGARHGVGVARVFGKSDGSELAAILDLADAGKLTPRVADVVPFDDVTTALNRVETGQVNGTVVLLPPS